MQNRSTLIKIQWMKTEIRIWPTKQRISHFLLHYCCPFKSRWSDWGIVSDTFAWKNMLHSLCYFKNRISFAESVSYIFAVSLKPISCFHIIPKKCWLNSQMEFQSYHFEQFKTKHKNSDFKYDFYPFPGHKILLILIC